MGEFPELQGVMGREYARAAGEPEAVAMAIFEHYLPRNASDSMPTQDPGAFIGLADRLDTLCGIFAIGKGPTGAADPFGLRRACLAVINIVLERGYRFSLSAAVDEALKLLDPKIASLKRKPGEAAPREQVLEFFRGRLKSLWSESYRTDVVEAVLAVGFDDMVAARKRLEALSGLVGRADFTPLAVAFKRVVNIVEKQGKDVAKGQTNPDKLPRRARAQPPHRLHPGPGQGGRVPQDGRLLRRPQGDHRPEARGGHLLRQGDSDGGRQGPAREPRPVPGGDRHPVQPGGRLLEDPGGSRQLGESGRAGI